jgi:pyruvate/2-oxoglutarate dehydrogenase complex dihydrolipoamide dehydrogenase (E3) component
MAAGILDRLPMFDRIVPEGVAWDDGRLVEADVILWATGFRPVINHLAPLHLREPGGGIRVEDTRAVLDPRVHLVGYGPSASTIGANRAGRTAVQHIRRLLAAPEAGVSRGVVPGASAASNASFAPIAPVVPAA